jgi:glycosyltransferase involved in cell wall biosynthesis
MRIALVAPPWAPIPPPLYGGIELVVDLLARGFAAAGHDVLLFATGDSTCPVPTKFVLDQAEGTRIGADVPELIHVLAAYDEIQDFGADIVHDHTMFGPLWAAHLPGVRAVTTVHGPLDGELASLYRRMADHTRIIAISHNQRRAAPDIPVARVIHHGIEASQFPMGTGGDYCLFLGRLDPDKGARRAIDVAKKAGVPLLLAGKMRNAAEREYFDREVAPFCGDDVKYLGEVSHEEKVQLLAGAKAVLFPIRWPEPFGLVMLEALACGTPVLAFPEGAAPEVIHDGETGFLCHDEADMAAELQRVDTLSREACRAAVEGYFSTERMVRDHLELFDDMLAGAQ